MNNPLRQLWARGRFAVSRQVRPRVPGRFQPYPYTQPDRYPWLFEFARSALRDVSAPRLLSFGCSVGDELVSLRRAFPEAIIRGLDIAPSAIAACRARLGADERVSVEVAADATGEPGDAYDAVFCLAVLCHGDLTVTRAERSDRLFPFVRFERAVADLARCVRPGGLLFIHTANFRFGDTATAPQFDTVLEANQEQLAADLLYDRDNRLIAGERYYPVGFRKRLV
ncbi:MAG: class I SAM-dependent methyltransferase [Sphingomicrobium sp.]